MRILHTADIHLKDLGDERWNAFEVIVRLAEDANVSALVISGDMFDRNAAAERLKPAVRGVFQRKPFQVAVLPGNHDDRSLESGDYFGETVTVLDRAGRYIDVGETRIIGFPFEKIDERKVIERLFSIRQSVKASGANLLLFHGELLDKFFDRAGYGEEEEYAYMPARLSYFEDLGVDYVLAGHFHTKFNVFTYQGGYFVYPGSPVSITKRETGRRNVNLFEIDSPPHDEPLDTHHNEVIEVHLNPSDTRHPLETIEERIRDCHEMATIYLTVSGHVDLESLGLDEKAFAGAIESLKTPKFAPNDPNQWKDVGEIINNNIFKRFASQLEETGLPEDRKAAVRSLVIDAFSEVLYAG